MCRSHRLNRGFAMPEDVQKTRLDFLYKALDDTQSTLKVIDTKAAFAIALLGALCAKAMEKDTLSVLHQGTMGRCVFSLFCASVIITGILAFKTVFPMIDP